MLKKQKIPKFKTIEEERAFWDTHSVVDYLSELEETKELIFERPPLKRNFQLRLDNEIKSSTSLRNSGDSNSRSFLSFSAFVINLPLL